MKQSAKQLKEPVRRGVFAIGLRRFLDWMDWMLPQAWDSRRLGSFLTAGSCSLLSQGIASVYHGVGRMHPLFGESCSAA